MNARTAAAFFAALLSVSALVAFAAEVSEPESSSAAPVRVSDARPAPCPDAATLESNVETASTAGETAPAAPTPSREKPRPSRRPTWPPPPELIS